MRITCESNETVISKLKLTLDNHGLRAAIAFLNSLTNQRFTSLFRFDGNTLRSVTFYDRENPDSDFCEDIPVQASYCVFVRDSGNSFATLDSRCDERVKDHPKRETVQSYCGVPLVDQHGKMYGTICHFDFQPGRVADADVELLEHMSRLLQKQLPSG